MTILKSFAERLLAQPAAFQAASIDAKLRLHFLDTIGAMAAGAASREGRELAGDSTAVFPLGRDPMDRLALAVARTRLTEVDDIHMPSCITPGAIIVPVVLFMSRGKNFDVARAAAGMRAGYDAMVRLGCAVDGARILYKGIWPTYLTAPIGAAACASASLGLDKTATAHALALSLAQVSGAAGAPSAGRNARWLLAGWAAANGVRAALAARDGFTGDLSLLDNDWFQKTHGIAFDASKLTGSPGSSLLEMSIKPWCIAKQACSGLAAFMQLLDGGINPAEITAVRIHVPQSYRAMIAHQPPGRIGRIVSMAWQCAVAAFHRDELLNIERPDYSHERQFSDFLRKVEVVADPSLDHLFPESYPARVEIETANGAVFEQLISHAPGDPGNDLDENEAKSKVERLINRQIDSNTMLSLTIHTSETIDKIRKLNDNLLFF